MSDNPKQICPSCGREYDGHVYHGKAKHQKCWVCREGEYLDKRFEEKINSPEEAHGILDRLIELAKEKK